MGADHKKSNEYLKVETGEIAPGSESIEPSVPDTAPLLITAEEFINKIQDNVEQEELPPSVKSKLLELAGKTQMEYIHFSNLVYALTVAEQELPESITKDGIKLNTTYETKNTPEDKALIEKKIDAEMQEAIYVVFSALKERKYPAGIQGSLAFVLEVGDDTAKEPNDIDAYAAIQDFPKTYESLKSKADAGEIVNLQIAATKNLEGAVNHGFEVSGYVKTGKNKDNLKQFSIFFQNIDPDKNPNGRVVNLGIEQRHFNEFEVAGSNGEKMFVPFGDKEGTVVVNLRSILWEFRLVDFENYKESKRAGLGVTAKFLQRFSNLMTLLKIPEVNSFDEIIVLLDKEIDLTKNKSPEFTKVVDMIMVLKRDFDGLSTKGEGLTKTICSKYEIAEHCNEKSFDLITKKINERMKEVVSLSLKAEQIFNMSSTQKDDKVGAKEKLNSIHLVLGEVEKVYDKYTEDLEKVNNDNPRDFGAYMALKALRDQFIWKVAEQLLNYDTLLKAQIKS